MADDWQTIGKTGAVVLELAKKQSQERTTEERTTEDIGVVAGQKVESGEMTTGGESKSQEMGKIVEV